MKRYISLVVLSFIALMFSSCLKDTAVLDPEGSKNVVEFYNETAPVSGATDPYIVYIPKTLEPFEPAEITATVSYSGAELSAPQDITVQLAPAPDAAATSGFDQLPTDVYEMPTSVVIRKGEKRAQFTITVNAPLLNADLKNALALSITSSSFGIISGNFSTVIFSLPVKNPYDGVYRYQTSSNTSLLPGRDVEVSLATIDSRRSRLAPGLLGYYSNQVDYVVDPETNSVVVEMNTLAPVATDPSSTYDPDTRTFHLKWTASGGGYSFEETLTYIKPRE